MTTDDETIYESDSVKIFKADRAPETAIITFSTFVESGEKPAIFGRDFVVSTLGATGIFVLAKYSHWWQVPDFREICSVLEAASSPFEHRIAYGGSKGGFGALLFGGRINCNRIVAVAPQTVISRHPEVPLDRRWLPHINSRPILHDDAADCLGPIVPSILFDPMFLNDRLHVDYLEKRAAIQKVEFPFSGHKVLATLKQCKILSEVMYKILLGDGDIESIRNLYNSKMEESPLVQFEIVRDSVINNDTKAALIAQAKIESMGNRLLSEKAMALIEFKNAGRMDNN